MRRLDKWILVVFTIITALAFVWGIVSYVTDIIDVRSRIKNDWPVTQEEFVLGLLALAFLVTVWILAGRLHQISRQPLSNEETNHHNDLLHLLERCKDADAYEWTGGASEGLYRLWFLGIQWPISIGKAKREHGDLTLITIPEENTLWPFLVEHLKGQQVLVDLEHWKQATIADIQKRCDVLAIGLKRFTETYNYPIAESFDQHASGKVSAQVFRDIFDLVVSSTVFSRTIFVDNTKFADEGHPGELWFDGHWIATGDPQMLRHVKLFLQSTPEEIAKTVEAQALKAGSDNTKEKSEILRKDVEKLLLVHRLPRGSECSQCP